MLTQRDRPSPRRSALSTNSPLSARQFERATARWREPIRTVNITGMISHSHLDYPLPRVLELKAASTVSVCIPARDEEATIGKVVESVAGLCSAGAVDEVLVVDSGSTDRTGATAEAAGARVVRDSEILPELGPAAGKGEALYKGLAATEGEIICWVDADVTNFSEHFVLGLVGPLLEFEEIAFEKAFYRRPLVAEGSGDTSALTGESGGGRVTELTARPLLAIFFPELAKMRQPISGEYAARRALLESLPFDLGYGVDVGLLIDASRIAGEEAIAECDIDIRFHRNRPLLQLAEMANEVSVAILRRAGISIDRIDLPPQRPPLESVRRIDSDR